MRQIGMAVLERARAVADGIDDARARKHGADRLIATAQSLGDRLDVRRDAFLLPGVARAGAAHAAHHLVEDEERAVPIADLADGAEISLRRRHAAGGRAHHRLGDERRHVLRAKTLEFRLQLGHQPRDEIRLGFAVAFFVIGEGRRHMAEGGRQQRRIGFAAPGVSAGGERTQRIAVIALATRDEALALRLAGLDKILPRQLDAGFDRFRTAADEIGVTQPAGLVADELVGQRFGRLRREEAGVGIGELRRLPGHRLEHARMLVAETGDRSPAGRIQNPPAILANQPDALAADALGGVSRRLRCSTRLLLTLMTVNPSRQHIATSRPAGLRSPQGAALQLAPPSTKVTAASDCAIAMAPVRLGKNPGDGRLHRAADDRRPPPSAR